MSFVLKRLINGDNIEYKINVYCLSVLCAPFGSRCEELVRGRLWVGGVEP
jgi:hypothetical protein